MDLEQYHSWESDGRDSSALLFLPTSLSQIADFGMSRNVSDDCYYITSGGRVPVKWTAPEVGKIL